ncbi:MAG TPA: hypothetical protein VJ396_09290 [Acidiferrobacterales bacterium]|nr:hypothetical protein [Acidiferrobacterales bacterium]
MNWKDTLGALAPTIATALGGPLAGAAVGVLSKALLGKPDGTEEELAPLIQQASPETLLKIKEAEKELKLGLAAAGVKLEEVAALDRGSARDREIKVGDRTTKILAYAYTIGYFAIFATMMKTGVSDQMENIVMVLLGVLTAAQGQIMNYYFGSSSGSAQKNELMAKLNGK